MTKCSALLPVPEQSHPSTFPSSHLLSPASECPCLTLINLKCKNCLQPPTLAGRWGLGPGAVQNSVVYGLAPIEQAGLVRGWPRGSSETL